MLPLCTLSESIVYVREQGRLRLDVASNICEGRDKIGSTIGLLNKE